MRLPQAPTPGGWELENFRENALFCPGRKVDNYISSCFLQILFYNFNFHYQNCWRTVHTASSNIMYGWQGQKAGRRHNSDNESIQCERQKLSFLCSLIPSGFIELGKKDSITLCRRRPTPDQFPGGLPLNNRLALNYFDTISSVWATSC